MTCPVRNLVCFHSVQRFSWRLIFLLYFCCLTFFPLFLFLVFSLSYLCVKSFSDVVTVKRNPVIKETSLHCGNAGLSGYARTLNVSCWAPVAQSLGIRRRHRKWPPSLTSAPRVRTLAARPPVAGKLPGVWDHGGSTPSPVGGQVCGCWRWHRGCHLCWAGRLTRIQFRLFPNPGAVAHKASPPYLFPLWLLFSPTPSLLLLSDIRDCWRPLYEVVSTSQASLLGRRGGGVGSKLLAGGTPKLTEPDCGASYARADKRA